MSLSVECIERPVGWEEYLTMLQDWMMSGGFVVSSKRRR